MARKIKKILLLGPIASGKDTQANILARCYGLAMVAMGNLLREEVARKTKLGHKASACLASGKLVPDELIFKIIKARLARFDCQRGFILDGFPRDLAQAKFLETLESPNCAIEIKLSDRHILERITGRRICLCGQSYHLKYNPPKIKNICDKCGKKLLIRSDDKTGIVKKRLKIFKKSINQLRSFYRRQGIYRPINGNQPIAKVQADLRKLIGR